MRSATCPNCGSDDTRADYSGVTILLVALLIVFLITSFFQKVEMWLVVVAFIFVSATGSNPSSICNQCGKRYW